MALAIEEAIQRRAPDVAEVVAEGAAEPAPAPLLQIELSDAWLPAGDLGALDAPVMRAVGGRDVLFVALDGTRYAYRPACPACGGSLAEARLNGARLECSCGRRYDVRHAGRSVDGEAAHLEPVPLLADGSGAIRVALA
jgi:nitrite reductase/ring-hydroxylating ferredoxin subunit